MHTHFGLNGNFFETLYLRNKKKLDLATLENDYVWLLDYFSKLEEYTKVEKIFLNKFILHNKINLTQEELLKKITIIDKMNFSKRIINNQFKKLC